MNSAAWLKSLFAAIDSRDAAAFATHLTDDSTFHFGNLPPVEGKPAITAFVDGFFAGIQGVKHEIEEHWLSGETIICRGTVTYHRRDGRSVSLPFANIMQVRDGLAYNYRIFADASPLFAAAG